MLTIRTEGRRRIRISVNRNRKDCLIRYSVVSQAFYSVEDASDENGQKRCSDVGGLR